MNQRFWGVLRNLREGGGSRGNRWSLFLSSCETGSQEGRKVRAPQGRVVRNTDCSVLQKGRGKESATEKKPPREVGLAATSQGKGEKAR